jgi:hypothetical protein
MMLPKGESTNVQAATSAASKQSDLADVPQYGLFKLLVLHLAPGALATLVYLALTPLALGLHFPAMAALLLSGAIALVPLEMGHLLLQGKRLNNRWSLAGVVLYRREWRGWRYLLTARAVSLVHCRF